VLEHPPNESVRAADEAGARVTVISKLVAANSLKAGLLVAVAVDLPERRTAAQGALYCAGGARTESRCEGPGHQAS
jgi:hypothetical protein